MTLVSVIMPAYNSQAYIEASINSVIKQTYSCWELIIINDGSTDNTSEIANKFIQTDKRIKVISQENQGETAARNTGLANASGKYIAFLDSDDLYMDTFLEKMVSRIQTGNCDAVYCGFKNIRENMNMGEPYAEGNILECYSIQKQHIWIVAFMIKKSFLEQYRITFTPSVTLGGDQEFIGLCGVFAQVKAVPEVLTIYQNNPVSMSNTISFKKRKEDILARDRVLARIHQQFNSPYKNEVITYFKKIRDGMVLFCKNAVWDAIKSGDLSNAQKIVNEFGLFDNVEKKKKIRKQLEVGIINTNNLFLWKMVYIIKSLESTLTRKNKSKPH